jgi:hypothetical protein
MAEIEHQPTEVDERGVVLTPEGRERARRQLAELDAHWTVERRRAAHKAFLARLSAS